MRRKRTSVNDQPKFVTSTNLAEDRAMYNITVQGTIVENDTTRKIDYTFKGTDGEKLHIRITKEHMEYFNKYGHMPFVMDMKRLINSLFYLSPMCDKEAEAFRRLDKNRKQSFKIAHKTRDRYFID